MLGRINKTEDLLYSRGGGGLLQLEVLGCVLKICQKQISALPSDEKGAMGRWRCSRLSFRNRLTMWICINEPCYTPICMKLLEEKKKAAPCTKVFLLCRLSEQVPKGHPRVGKLPDWVSRARTPHKRSPTPTCVSGYEQSVPHLGPKNE